MDCERLPPKCIDALTAGSAAEKIRAAVKRLNESFVAWAHLTQELQAILPHALMPGVGASMDDCSLSALVQYAKNLQAALNHFGALADPLLGANPPADMRAFVADLKQAEEMQAWEASQATEAESWSKQLGPAFQGVGTDWDVLRKCIHWARSVRECLGRMHGGADKTPPVSQESLLQAATGTPPSSRELRHALTPYEQELHHLEVRFDAPGPTLDARRARHSPEKGARSVDQVARSRRRCPTGSTGAICRSVSGISVCDHSGIGCNNTTSCGTRRRSLSEIVLERWIDAMFQSDPASINIAATSTSCCSGISRTGSQDSRAGWGTHAAILDPAQSQNLDETQLAILMKEAHKKTKHMPLRQLFVTIPHLVQRLKPCVLMSPLSVSQYLPGGDVPFKFDLVVFDEASQILPEDAVGAIYRGKQLVVTGDNQQLPPTMFFQQSSDDLNEEEESPLFESTRRMSSPACRSECRAGTIAARTSVIAFSNETLRRSLVTFPSAAFANPARRAASSCKGWHL